MSPLTGTLYPLFVLLLLRLALHKQGLAIVGLVLFLATNFYRGNPVSAIDHVLVLLILAVIGAYGFYTSVGGQKLLSGALLEGDR